ncbi:MAG: hypothetical protein ACO1SV_02695 [Fimbriimonas sp.]
MTVPSRFVALSFCAVFLAACARHDATPAPTAKKPVNRATRVAVKHGVDADAAKINLQPKTVALGELASYKAPGDLGADIANPEYQKRRIAPFETQVWRVDANVKSVVHRKDGDYYMVLTAPDGSESVVEVPDPKLCEGSRLHDQIAAAREDIEKRFHPTDTPKEINQRATVDGVGFFGFKGKSGGTGARLMPGLGFRWK